MNETTMQDACEFARSVAEELRCGSGVHAFDVVDGQALALDDFVVDAERREAAIREVLADEFTIEETKRLLSLSPRTHESRTFARIILTAATRIASRQPDRGFDLATLVKFLLRQFIRFLEPKETREDAERRRQPATH